MKIKKSVLFSVLLIVLSFVLSLILYLSMNYVYRQVFVFEGLDKNRLYVEERFFPSVKNVDKVELYVSELVLGPIGNRYKNLFAPGTKVKSCFVRGKNLYVELSKEALIPEKNTTEFSMAVKIFEKNIRRNFHKIKNIHLYIDGVAVGEI